MGQRILVKFFIGTILKVGTYVGLLYLIKMVLSMVSIDPKIQLNDYGINLSTIIFCFIIGLQNLITAVVDNKWFTWVAMGLVLIIYATGWGEDYVTWPIRTAIYFLVGYGIIISKPTVDRALYPRPNQPKHLLSNDKEQIS